LKLSNNFFEFFKKGLRGARAHVFLEEPAKWYDRTGSYTKAAHAKKL
jgi:hypothetical protein